MDLLQEACRAPPGPERLLHVVAFALCGYAGTLERTAKPFNPLLGETFEWRSADEACRFLSEQVRGPLAVATCCFLSESHASMLAATQLLLFSSTHM